ncbi:hypothetical protein Bbelb_195740 [Branchiostoma belcheri]|nr:hypothetical protein Bbelb_195740 [Branchiostoma belcheri]
MRQSPAVQGRCPRFRSSDCRTCQSHSCVSDGPGIPPHPSSRPSPALTAPDTLQRPNNQPPKNSDPPGALGEPTQPQRRNHASSESPAPRQNHSSLPPTTTTTIDLVIARWDGASSQGKTTDAKKTCATLRDRGTPLPTPIGFHAATS